MTGTERVPLQAPAPQPQQQLPERQRRPSFAKFRPNALGLSSEKLKKTWNSTYASSLPNINGASAAASDYSRSSSDATTWSEASSEDGSPLTPDTDLLEDGQISVTVVANKLPAKEIDVSRTGRKGVSTKLLTQDASVLQEEIGKGESGTQLIQKYCCGGGCCLLNLPPPSETSIFTPIDVPDNEAFRSLNLKLGTLALDSELSNITDLPPETVSIETIPKSANLGPKSTVAIHPPNFVQPHPPYHVFSAPLYSARELTKPGAEKRTFHFDVDVTDYPDEGDVDFKVGGAVGVVPGNRATDVEEIFDLLGVPKFLRDRQVLLKTIGGRWPTIWGEEQERSLTTTRREVLTWCSDIQSYPPTKNLLRLLAEHASAPNEKKILTFLASGQGQGAFCDLRTGPHLSLLQLLHAFPSSKPPFSHLLSCLSQLMPRFYSLSNDPHVSSEREGLAGRRLIELAVTVHESAEWKGAVPRKGTGSGFLERLARKFIETHENESLEAAQALDLRVPLFRGLMANPLSKEFGSSDGPMMLIGAGVGMAPFRGFILNRLRKATCANKIWLVQGIRDSSVDELYSGELGQYESQIKKVVQSRAKSGLGRQKSSSEANLTTLANAASEQWKKSEESAQSESKYVQDEVRQQADIVWDVIKAVDGRVFVCGSSKGMGEGVEQALKDVAIKKGMSAEGAEHFWEEMKEAGKYIAETW